MTGGGNVCEVFRILPRVCFCGLTHFVEFFVPTHFVGTNPQDPGLSRVHMASQKLPLVTL